MRFYVIIITVITLISCWDIALAADVQISGIRDAKNKIQASYEVKKGVLSIDMNGDGAKDLVVTGQRNDIMAHNSYYVHSFYITTPESLKVIEIKEQDDKEDLKESEFLMYTRPFDGEAIVSALRLLKLKGLKELFLLKVYREIGTGYSDPSDTYFDIYKLKYDDLDARYLYIKIASLKTKAKYENALEALNELGIKWPN